MRWLSAPEMFDEPDKDLLEMLNLSRIARNYHVAPWALANVPYFWMQLGELDIDVQHAISKRVTNKTK